MVNDEWRVEDLHSDSCSANRDPKSLQGRSGTFGLKDVAPGCHGKCAQGHGGKGVAAVPACPVVRVACRMADGLDWRSARELGARGGAGLKTRHYKGWKES